MFLCEVLDIAPAQIAKLKALTKIVVRWSGNPVANLHFLYVALGLIAVAGLADPKDDAGPIR